MHRLRRGELEDHPLPGVDQQLVEQRTGRVDSWKNSNEKQRWLAVALLDIEPRLREIKGYRYLPVMRRAMQKEMEPKTKQIA